MYNFLKKSHKKKYK